jgi:predicted nucleic acid-binding protein
VPQQALDVIESKQLPLYISPSIRDEVTGILLKKFDWSQQDIKAFLPRLWQRTILVRPTIRLTVCVDPDDNHVFGMCGGGAGRLSHYRK